MDLGEDVLDEAVELLTKMMIEEDFKNKKNKKDSKIVISKMDLYKLCIKLLKLIKREMED
ncbi:MAG: hypothetical protein IJ842_02090 [Bacilli bacterium]|nr:hypothetical protein [Bacilli bacterium]